MAPPPVRGIQREPPLDHPPAMILSTVALLGTMTLAASTAESLGTFRVAPRATNTHALRIGPRDHWLTVSGTGKTNLDCWLYTSGKQLVDSDTDGTDYCVLSTDGPGKYRLVVRNHGRVASAYTVRVAERLR